MTEKDYNNAVNKRAKLTKEIKTLSEKILKYENESKRPEFWDIKDVRSFVMYEGVEGSLFTFEEQTYEVGDIDELERDYGYESVHDGLYSASIETIEANFGLIRKMKDD